MAGSTLAARKEPGPGLHGPGLGDQPSDLHRDALADGRRSISATEQSTWPGPAVAQAASQEPELACAVAQEAAVIVHGTWSARAVAALRRLPTLLCDWPDLALVGELEATLAALP